MLKLGHLKDVDRYSIPQCITKKVIEDLKTLDDWYGEDRDIDNDMGGFVVICGKYEVLHIPNFEENIEEAEYIQNLGEYQKALYISGSERNIIIYRCKEDKRMLHK